MKTSIKQLDKKTIKELISEIEKIRQEISKLQLEKKVSPPKDTNTIKKKRKQLAILLTVMRERQIQEQLKNKKI